MWGGVILLVGATGMVVGAGTTDRSSERNNGTREGVGVDENSPTDASDDEEGFIVVER